MQQLWAPWRLDYVENGGAKKSGCFFCHAWQDQGNEKEHLLLFRGKLTFVMFNRYPYNNGHLLAAPVRHVGSMEETTVEEGREMWEVLTICKKILTEVFNADGFNIGINQGKVAGAGVLDHIHAHIVPRWNGDTNFMPVMADVRVIPQSLEAAFVKLAPHFSQYADNFSA